MRRHGCVRTVCLPLALLLLNGCGRATTAPTLRTLASGKQVEVLSVRRTVKNGYATLHVDYATHLPVTDHVALAPEVDEIWSTFRQEAEDTAADAVMISARGKRPSDVATFPITRVGKAREWRAPRVVALASGKHVLLVSTHTQYDAFFVEYVSTLPIKDMCALAPEVDEVWAAFRVTAEATGVKLAFVVPNETPLGGCIAFAFHATDRGGWERTTAGHCGAARREAPSNNALNPTSAAWTDRAALAG